MVQKDMLHLAMRPSNSPSSNDAAAPNHRSGARPQTAGVAWVPARRPGTGDGHGCCPVPRRPASAASSGSGATPARWTAALERLKAQLAEVAAGSSMQLHSLQASTAHLAVHMEQAAQVPGQDPILDTKLTYAQARKVAAAQPASSSITWQPPRRPSFSPASQAAACGQPEFKPGLQRSGTVSGRRSIQRTSVFSASVRRSFVREHDSSSAAAAASLREMKQWAQEQQLSMMEPEEAAWFVSKAVAAHIGMLQSENLALQYQRQLVEAEVQELQAQQRFHWVPEQTEPDQQLNSTSAATADPPQPSNKVMPEQYNYDVERLTARRASSSTTSAWEGLNIEEEAQTISSQNDHSLCAARPAICMEAEGYELDRNLSLVDDASCSHL